MEIPDSGWIESSLLSDQEQDHALYATDLPPLHSQHSNLFAKTLHQFEEDLQQFPQPEQHQQGLRAGSSGNDASARRVHKADRERLRRDKLNEQFTELASALDPDRPKNDKATILSDSVQELNELRAEVKRLKTEHASLLDESRDLTQEKSELREEKALLKSETEQLQSQLQERLRLALSWPVDPTLMFPYPVPLPTPPPAPSNPSSPSSTSSTSPQIPQQLPQIPQMPYLPLPPPYGMHPYATMYANRPPTGTPNVPYFPYFPPHAIVASTNNTSNVDRPFPHFPTPVHAMPGAPPFFPPSDALFKASYQAPPRPREESTEQPRPDSPQRQPESAEDATNSSQVESSGVKQEAPQVQSLVKSLSPVADVSSDVGYSAAA